MEQRVTVEITGGVADVRLTRADKMNALDDAMFAALIEAGERVKADASVRAAVLSGEGRAFCAGLDASNFEKAVNGAGGAGDPAGAFSGGLGPRTHGLANRWQQAVWVWREMPVPVIAAVHGVAFGGGFQLMLGPDMRFIAPDAKLSVMEIKWGLTPDMAGTLLMRDLVRDDVARDLTYTGRIFSGEDAGRFGFATRVVADPRAEALAAAREIAGKSPHAIRAAKRLFNDLPYRDVASGLMAESVEQDALMGSPNQLEAVISNLQKREPRFTD
jgi:enoyl-CoA hydratase/carnithine racemase